MSGSNQARLAVLLVDTLIFSFLFSVLSLIASLFSVHASTFLRFSDKPNMFLYPVLFLCTSALSWWKLGNIPIPKFELA